MNMETETIEVVLPIRLESRANARGHWKARHATTQFERGATWWLLPHKRRAEIQPPCRVHLVRIAPRRLDGDNLQTAFKAVRDSIADFIGIDDGSDLITWTYDQEKGARRQYAVRLTISWSSENGNKAETDQAAGRT